MFVSSFDPSELLKSIFLLVDSVSYQIVRFTGEWGRMLLIERC